MSKPERLPIRWNADRTPPALAAALQTLGEEYPLAAGSGGGIHLSFHDESKPDTCRLVRKDNEALVYSQNPQLALRAVGTLMAGLVPDGGEGHEQTPFHTFGIMLDCSRNAVMTVEHFKGWLRRLALLGYNMAMLYTEDTYELPGEDTFGYLRGAYSREELKTIDAYARRLGIEMIPCIQTLGHLSQVLKWPAYSEIRDTANVLLADEEKTGELVARMLTHCGSAFRSRRIHIGMDEANDLGRGRHLDRFGHEPAFDIFSRHLAQVVSLCSERGLQPMAWSDPVCCAGSPTTSLSYYREDPLPPEAAAAVPDGVQLVYWDYYHADSAFYEMMIRKHRAAGFEPIVASCVRTQWRLWYDRDMVESHARACIEACRRTGVKELFFTLWGDDGAACDIDSALAGLTYTAEQAFRPDAVADSLVARFRAVCGADYSAHRLAAGPVELTVKAVPTLWDDPLLGIYLNSRRAKEPNVLEETERQYLSLAAELAPHRGDSEAGNLDHARLLADALAAKIGLTHRLVNAYAEKDRAALAAVRAEVPGVAGSLEALLASFRKLWLERNKPFGLEVIQIRIGGLLARYEELAQRLDELLAGQVESIPELDANLPAAPAPLGNLPYHRLATASDGL